MGSMNLKSFAITVSKNKKNHFRKVLDASFGTNIYTGITTATLPFTAVFSRFYSY
jgi:hypothetical protein